MSHNLRSTLIKLAIFAVFSILLTSIVFNSLLASSTHGQVGYSADFSNASGLRAGNAVRIAGVQVGKITDVSLRGTHARVAFKLDDDQHPTTTTTAVINYANLLGQRFVNLLPGKQPGQQLHKGAVIPMNQTTPGLDLTAVFNGFQPLFSALSPDEVNKLAGSVVQVLQGQSGTVESLFKQTAVITNDLADRQQLVDSVLTNLSTLLTSVGAHDAQIGQLIDNFDSLVANLGDDQQSLGATVTGLGQLTTNVGNLLNQAQPALDNDIAGLTTVTQTLSQQQAGLDGAIQGLPDLLTTFTKPLSSGSFLNAYLCNLTINVSQIGDTSTGPTLPVVISLNPSVPASTNLYPNPIYVPRQAREVAGAGTTSTAACS